MKRTLTEQSGFSLLETMISLGIGAVIVLAIGNSVNYAAKSYNSSKIGQEEANFKDILRTALLNPSTCATLITGPALDPGLVTPQPITLTVGPSTSHVVFDTGVYKNIGTSLQIASILFQKNQDAFAGGMYTTNNVQYWPVNGTISVKLTNIAAQNNWTFGAKQIVYNLPITVTFQQTVGSGTWSIGGCLALAPATSLVNSGWKATDTANPAYCYQMSSTATNSTPCAPGMYVVAQNQVNVPTSITTYSPSCSCHGTCKGCVCVAGSSCASTCSGSTPTIVADSCMGTCSASASCPSSTSIVNVPTFYMTCCNVQK